MPARYCSRAGAGGEGRAACEHAALGRTRHVRSPTFFVGDEIFFGKDRLRDVEEAIIEARIAPG